MTRPAVDTATTHIAAADSPRPSEQEWVLLIRRVAQGDQQALAAFYDATSTLVYGFAMRMLGNTATAEEVTLDVYTQVWRQAASYNQERGTPSAAPAPGGRRTLRLAGRLSYCPWTGAPGRRLLSCRGKQCARDDVY